MVKLLIPCLINLKLTGGVEAFWNANKELYVCFTLLCILSGIIFDALKAWKMCENIYFRMRIWLWPFNNFQML